MIGHQSPINCEDLELTKMRMVNDDSPRKFKKLDSSKKYQIPFIPKFLYNYLDKVGKKNMTNLRSMVNVGKTMAPDELWK